MLTGRWGGLNSPAMHQTGLLCSPLPSVACPMLCFASIHQAAGFLLVGEDAIGKHSSSVLPMGESDESRTGTYRGLRLHHHGRQQIKRMKLSQTENILKVAVLICSPLKGRSKMPTICYQLWEWV